MRRSQWLLPLVLSLATACGPSPEAKTPGVDSKSMAKAVTTALEIEARKPAAEALTAWGRVLKEATADGARSPMSRAAALAALDALTGRTVFGLESLGELGSVQRVADGPTKVAALLDELLASEQPMDAAVHAYAAVARMKLAAQKGDAAVVKKARDLSGCVTEATIAGPFVGPVLGQLDEAGPLDGGSLMAPANAPAASNPALAIRPAVTKSDGRGCNLSIVGDSKAAGLRYVDVDVMVSEPGPIHIGVESALPFVMLAGGKTVTRAGYGDLTERTLRFGTIDVTNAGTVRVVVKVGAYANDSITLYAIDAHGRPLPAKAASGDAPKTAIGAVKSVSNLAPNAGTDAASAETIALSLLAMGEARVAETLVEPFAKPATPGGPVDPAAALVWGRALAYARDLPPHRKLERQRAAYERTLAGWADAWEAMVGISQIVTLQRRGGAGEVEGIGELRKRLEAIGAAGKPPTTDPLVDAWLAIVGDDILGIGDAALARAKPALASTHAGFRLDRATVKETDAAVAKAYCEPTRLDLSDFSCASAKLRAGEPKGTVAEIGRLRALFGSPKLGAELEISATLRDGGPTAAKPLFDAADVTDRSAQVARQLAPAGADGVAWMRRQLRTLDGDPRALHDLVLARRAAGDASGGEDVGKMFDERTRALIAKDRAKKAQEDAGTVILDRFESYALDADGFLYARLWDVRRLSGTTDVEANAVARGAVSSTAFSGMRKTVHRIFKADGTIVEPDKIEAAQSGAELSQIEPGDYVELVSEGWFLARPDGAIDLDTSDLLPARTAVVHAAVEISAPTDVPIAVWGHPELKAPTVTTEGGRKKHTFAMTNHEVRRGERSQSAMDAQVAVRMGSWSWNRLAREAREGVLQTEEQLPEVSSWVEAAVGKDRTPSVDLLVRLLKETKRSLPRVGFLPLGPGNEFGPQAYDTRTVLLDAQGSRVALMHRALEQLGVKHEIVWSEMSPYSADTMMLARPWRFSHAMLIAEVSEKPGEAAKRVWLDPDVEGTPPPPGRTSPELRGRTAITMKGEIVPVPPNPEGDPDVATIEWTVDDSGHAKGTIALLLRGRDAQEAAAILEETAGDQRDDALRELVSSWVPDTDVTEPKASTETWQVVVTAKLEREGFLVPDGSRHAVAGLPPLHLGSHGTLGATFASQAKRTTALTIRLATLYNVHRVIHLPKGTAVATPLPNLDVSDATTTMKASRSVKVDGSTLIDDLAFSLPTSVVPVDKFEEFTTHARAVDDGFGAAVRVTSSTLPTTTPAVAASTKAAPLTKLPPVPAKKK